MKRSRGRKTRKSRSSLEVIRGPYDTLSKTAGITVRRTVVAGGANITLTPSAGFGITGITTGFSLGVAFSARGILLYNASVGVGTFAPFTFTDYTSYNTIFDQYRIKKVRLQGWFQNNTSNTSSTTNGMPLFYVADDFDNNGIPVSGSANAVLQYSNSKVYQANSAGRPAFTRTIQPRVTNTLNNTILATQFTGLMPPNSWVDTATDNCPHFGIVLAYDPLQANQATSIGGLALVAELEIEYRGAR